MIDVGARWAGSAAGVRDVHMVQDKGMDRITVTDDELMEELMG